MRLDQNYAMHSVSLPVYDSDIGPVRICRTDYFSINSSIFVVFRGAYRAANHHPSSVYRAGIVHLSKSSEKENRKGI